MCKVIELVNINKKFKNKEILKNINLKINKGNIVGIIGKNGSGKSVLFNIVAGLIAPESGEVIVNEEVIGKDVDFPKDVGIFIDQPSFINFYNGFYNLYYLAQIMKKIDKDRIIEVMEEVGLDPNDRTHYKNFSLGMKQKLGICQAIMEYQDILLLDEPFNALDYDSHRDIKNIIKKLKEDKKTMVLTSHNHSDLEELCDYIYLLEEGRLIVMDELVKNKYFY